MIATSTVPWEERNPAARPSKGSGTGWCQVCGQSVPAGMSVCYGCDVEMGVGDWPYRPRRQADLPRRFLGLRRSGRRFRHSPRS